MMADAADVQRLLALADALSSALTPRDTARVVAAHVAAAVPCDFAGLLKLDDNVFTHLASSDPDVDHRWVGYRFAAEHPSGFTRAIQERVALSTEDTLRASASVRRICEVAGIRAGTIVPLLSPRRPLGLLYLAYRRPTRPPDRDTLAYLQGVAQQAAVALDRGVLLQELQRTARAAHEQERQLRERHAELERLVFLIAHDLRAPLVSIRSFLHHLDEELRDGTSPNARFYLERIAANCRHLIDLNHQILEFMRVGRDEPVDERVELAEVVAETLAALQPRIQESQAAIDVGSLPAVHGNRTRLVQLFQNLIENALHYGKLPERTLKIRISAEEQNGAWRITVWNNGPPIPRDAASRVFDLFYRLPDAVEKNPSGIGAGLATVRRIVETLGGTVGLESDENGVSFWFTLPGAPRPR